MINDNNLVENITHYPFSKEPTIIDGVIKENCHFNLSTMGDTMIIDKDFLDEMISFKKRINNQKELMGLLKTIRKNIKEYFFSNNGYNQSRKKFYEDKEFCVFDNDGANIGVEISKTKGKNIAECAEKSIAAYTILELLFQDGKINYKPSLVISSASFDNKHSGLHAFLILDKESGSYPTESLIFDPENDTLVETNDGIKYYVSGVYALTEDEKNDIINGFECSPISIYDAMNAPCHEIGEKRVYGSSKKTVLK